MKRFVRRALSTVQEVLPHRVQEKEGRNAVHGRRSVLWRNNNISSRSAEESSSEDEASDTEHNVNAQVKALEDPETNGNRSTSLTNERSNQTAEQRTSSLGMGRQVFGNLKYTEKEVIHNLLPYVYTLPDLNTWCARTDGIYILCDPCFDLPANWTETFDEVSINPSNATRTG
ncbi:hypothetical protein FGB62_1g418 [Gracilaria domingensis]|nr:hypothetical protein FGB62_1g418 [Gracilaria domingensis]